MQNIFTNVAQRKINVIFYTFLLPVFINAQSLLKSGDVVYAEADQQGGIYTVCKSSGPNEMEWLGKLAGVTIHEIADYQTSIQKKSKIKAGHTAIPVNKGYIISNPNFKKWKHSYVVVRYRVKKGETMYSIARQYFDTSEDNIVAINKKSDYSVKTGEELIMGWLLLPEITSIEVRKAKKEKSGERANERNNTVKTITPQKEVRQEPPVKQVPEEVLPRLKEETFIQIEKNVIGIWDKNGSASENYYALFNDVAPGNYIEAYNPMLKRAIKAKVIGRIPAGTYAADIELILNPAAAKELGLLDIRFKALVKYMMKE
jgi:hypothetical protein